MKLRDYQSAAIDAIRADWQNGILDTLAVLPTGAGKTNVFLSIVLNELDANPAARSLILAHRRELIAQPLDRIAKIDPDWAMRGATMQPRVGVIMANRNDCDRQLTIATVQSLASGKRLGQLLSHGPIDLFVCDEVHHITAPTHLRVYQALKEANPALKNLGVTATPLRADGDGLSRVYQSCSVRITIADMVQAGWLVQPRWLGIKTNISISGITSSGGDFVQSQLAKVFDTPAGRAVVLKAYREYAGQRRAVAFTASVAGAHELAAAFNAAGITAAAIDGTTPKDERAATLAAFQRGEIQVLSNCDVLSEGWDCPGLSCVLMCRPTRSDSAYVQRIGRGLRPALGTAQPGEDCLILDFLPEEVRNIVMAGDVLGLPRDVTRVAVKESDVEPGEAQAGFTFDGEHFDASGTPLEIVARQLDYLELSPFVWDRRDGWLVLGLGKGSDERERILAITPPRADEPHRLYGLWRDDGTNNRWKHGLVMESADFDALSERANELAAKHGTGILVEKDRAWHKQPISDGQRRFLVRLASQQELGQLERFSKGEAARMINFYVTRQALQRAGVWS